MDILIVEDEPDIASLIAQALQREGLAARRAPNLAEARRALAERLPAVLLVDLGLADGSGLQLVREMAGRGPFS